MVKIAALNSKALEFELIFNLLRLILFLETHLNFEWKI